MSAALVIASAEDAAALWACGRLRARGHECELLLTTALELGDARWVHRVSAGDASVELRVPGGRCIRSGDFAAVLNRMISPPLTLMARMGWQDSAYARSEQIAFSLSWLNALAPRVVNPPAARGLAGAWRSALEWSVLARAAGLPTATLALDSDVPDSIAVFPSTPINGLVIGTEAFGVAAQPEVRAGCVRLAEAADTLLLGIWFVEGDPPLLFMATPHPDLRLGGEAAIDALAGLLGP